MTQPRKIVILGHFGVGKTSLIRQYVDASFSEDYLVTVGLHVKKKDVIINDNTVTLVVWDIEGHSEIASARASYLLGSSGFIYVFDVSRPETYANLENQMEYLKEHFPGIPIEVFGNKCDKFKDEVSKVFFETPPFNSYLFTSAKTGENVEEGFMQLTIKTLVTT
ncbi:Rab family GTPase [Patiriisocius sp. Uisw_047]|jgi:small GTP-binding protein|uniref:Rab family GTPase n=1 Tax=Patiriisocius sp. Uisw_047 TaxID=3230969 RepID=UPI0039EB0937